MDSCTPHLVSSTTESSILGHWHKRIPHPWPWNSTTNRLHMFPKDNSTKDDTTTQDTCSPEGHNNKSTKVQGDKQEGSKSETPKCSNAWWCNIHQWKEIQPTHYQRIYIKGIQYIQCNRDTTRGWVPQQAEGLQTSPTSTSISPSQTQTSIQRAPAYAVNVSSYQCGRTLKCRNSIVPERKAYGSLRLCLDPKDLNKNTEGNHTTWKP